MFQDGKKNPCRSQQGSKGPTTTTPKVLLAQRCSFGCFLNRKTAPDDVKWAELFPTFLLPTALQPGRSHQLHS